MKEPKRLPLTDNPKSKYVNQLRLEAIDNYPSFEEIIYWNHQLNENHNKNNSESIQQLESDQIN